jgi:enoyl-CoA hydratase
MIKSQINYLIIMTDKIATLKKDDNISIITLDDGKANVFSPEMSKQINECLDEVATEEGCLIITGREGMFSGGLDLKIIQSGDIDRIQEMSFSAFKLLARIFSFPRPVIAACSGHAVALGTFLLCCCDYRIGVKGEFMLGANEMRTNMVIPTPILELIKFRVSNAHKYRAVLGAEMYTLEDSLAAGLLDEVVDQDLLTSAVNEKAQDLATMGHPSYSMTKELFIADPMSKINTAMEELKNNS